MRKRTVREKAAARAKWSETFKDGFDHGYSMGYTQGLKDAREGGENDTKLDKMDRRDHPETSWAH